MLKVKIILVASIVILNSCIMFKYNAYEDKNIKINIMSTNSKVSINKPNTEIKLIIVNTGNKKIKIMKNLEITTNKNHRCYALYANILSPDKGKMNFLLNSHDIFLHPGFEYVAFMPNDTVKTSFQINFKELFLERVGNPNLNFGTYTITVTLRDLYKNKVPETTSEPLFVDYQKD